jgi:uncharacterized protein (TIGR03084 family)
MGAEVADLCDDLLAERRELDAMLQHLDPGGWSAPTPAPGWSVRDQVTHLAYFDERARDAIVEPERFRTVRAAAVDDITGFVEAVAAEHTAMPGRRARAWLAAAGAELIVAARGVEPRRRVPWYGPDMSVASTLTARLMETWAHGQDIAAACAAELPVTDRLRHVAFLGASTVANSFAANGLAPPERAVRVELTAPSGATWAFGPVDSEDVVCGAALEFCLVVTQRRHRADTSLRATGPIADRWLDIAQAFAGPPGAGRPPRGRS